jgi:hypothetical protein
MVFKVKITIRGEQRMWRAELCAKELDRKSDYFPGQTFLAESRQM